jgi:hypothetical protein
MSTYFFSSCQNDGGLHKLDPKGVITTLDSGNIRGLTQIGSYVFYVKDNKLFKTIKDKTFKVFDLPSHGHDIKYRKNLKTLLFMGTEKKKLYELSLNGKTIREIEYDSKYWMNCIGLTNKGIIVFLSCKRPRNESKILYYDQDFKIISEYECPEKDEIHSPFFYRDNLYWCVSNKNLVVKSDLRFKNIKEVAINYDGYTRGLHIDDRYMMLGTSENRHAENSKCTSNLNQGCIHQYENKKILKSLTINCKEVYDIIKYKNVKNHL